MTKKPLGRKDRNGDPVPTPSERATSGSTAASDDVLGDLIDSDFDVAVTDDGSVRIHARCPEGSDAAACAERTRFLVEALGADFVPPPELAR